MGAREALAKKWTTPYFNQKLKRDNAPEKYILEKLQNDDAFIEAIDKSEAFKSFITNL